MTFIQSLVFIVVACFSLSFQALACDDNNLSPKFRQLRVGTGFFSEVYKEKPSQILNFKIENLGFWKEKTDVGNNSCLSDFVMRLQLIYSVMHKIDGVWMTCSRNDHIIGNIDLVSRSQSDYTSVTESYDCQPSSIEQVKKVEACEQVKCRRRDQTPTYANLNNDCSCDFLSDIIQLDEVGEKYSDFYSKGKFVGRPDGFAPWSEIEAMYDRIPSIHQQ